MSESLKEPIEFMEHVEIRGMIDKQVKQEFDYYRMKQFWMRLLKGGTPPETIAEGLCMALSGGRYELRTKPVTQVVNVYVSGVVDPEQLSSIIAKSVRVGGGD